MILASGCRHAVSPGDCIREAKTHMLATKMHSAIESKSLSAKAQGYVKRSNTIRNTFGRNNLNNMAVAARLSAGSAADSGDATGTIFDWCNIVYNTMKARKARNAIRKDVIEEEGLLQLHKKLSEGKLEEEREKSGDVADMVAQPLEATDV